MAVGGNLLEHLSWTPPRSVQEINRLVAGERRSPAFLGADVGADLALPDGRRLWVFGDTVRAPDHAAPRIVHNSVVITSRDSIALVVTPDRGAVIPDRADGVGYWPTSLWLAPPQGETAEVWVAAQRVASTGLGTFDFRVLGPALAVLRVEPGGAPRLDAVHDLGPDAVAGTLWGAAAVRHEEFVLLYGTRPSGRWAVFGSSLHLARATPDDVLDRSRWEYWTGADWAADPAPPAALIPADEGVSQVLSVFPRGDAWYAVSKRGDVFGSELVVWKAPAPTGPFAPGPVVAEIPSRLDEGVLRYMPLAHPDLPASPGHVVVSYSRNAAGMAEVLAEPYSYRPEFLEVPLP